MENFGRQIEVLIGPLEEGKKGDPAQALRIFSDGSQDALRISFQIQKSAVSIPNASMITIWNLNEDTRALLNTGKLAITVNGGWANGGKLPLLFVGGIVAAYSDREGADIVTRIMALTMGDALSCTVSSFTFKSGMYVVDCLMQTIGAIDGIVVDPNAVKINNDVISIGGLSFAGQVKDLLDILGRQYGFTWSIQDGIFYAIGDQTAARTAAALKPGTVAAGTPLILDGKEGALINLSPLLAGPLQIVRGVKIRTFVQPGLAVHAPVTVVNSVNSQLDNDYIMHTLDLRGDTFSNDWIADIQSLFTF